MEFALAFGAVGDFLALGLLIKDIVSALDDCRGSEKDYRDLIESLEGLGKTLQQVEQVYRDPQIINTLDDLSEIARCTLEQIRQCLEGFHNHLRKYESTLGPGGTGSRLKGVVRKIQWKLEEKDVSKFRADVAGYAVSLKVLLEVTTIRIIQRNHDAATKQVSDAENRMGSLIRKSSQSVKGYLEFLGRRIISKLDIVFSLGTDLTTSTRQILAMMCAVSGDLTSIKAVVMRLDRGISDEHFVLEDVTGRHFPIHLKTITSWEAFEYVLNDRFKGKKGAHRVQRKMYFLQERATRQDVDRSTDWESAFLPYQRVDMSMMCREAQKDAYSGVSTTCPWCQTPSSGESGVEVQCGNCNKHFTRVVEVEDEEILPDAPQPSPSPNRTLPSWFRELSSPMTTKRKRNRHDSDSEEDNDCCKCNRKRLKGQDGRKRKRSGENTESDSDDEDVRGFARIRLVSKRKRTKEPETSSQAASTERVDPMAQKASETAEERPMELGWTVPKLQPRGNSPPNLDNDDMVDEDNRYESRESSPSSYFSVKPGRWYTSGANYETRYRYSFYDVDDFDNPAENSYRDYAKMPRRPATRARHRFYPSSETSYRSAFEKSPFKERPAKLMPTPRQQVYSPPTARKATEADAKKHQIPPGYSLAKWDPDEEPVRLLGSVFDHNSIGKWIYDWAYHHHGPTSPICEQGGELWLLLIQLAGKLKRGRQLVGQMRDADERQLVEEFNHSGERLAQYFQVILKCCEGPMLKTARGKNKPLGKDAGAECIEALFVKGGLVAETDKFMQRVRAFKLRFDGTCDPILRKAEGELPKSAELNVDTGGED